MSISFLTTLFLMKYWIKMAKSANLVGRDMNKYNKPKIAESGGVAVIFGSGFGILAYIFLNTFYLQNTENLIFILAILCTVLLAAFIGFIDDVLGRRMGLKYWQKVLLTIPIAIPLMVVNVGHEMIELPFIGVINLGLFYPLILVPIIIIGSTNGFNILAGYNGLEAGMGVIILSTLGIIAYSHYAWLSLLVFLVVLSLLAFLMFNWFPAKVFPGDSLTYPIGAMIAITAILGNAEKAALILFVPYFIDLFLLFKAVKFKNFGVDAFAKPNPDDSLELPYTKLYDTTHIILFALKKVKKAVFERDVVRSMLGAELILALIVLLMMI